MVKKARCEDVLTAFMEGARGAVFFTLTTPDVVEVQEIRRRWREMRHWLVRVLGKGAKYVMNYEIHPGGHGWHIHSVWNRYIDLRKHLDKIRSFGFGRVDIRRVDSKGVADYLTKHALKAYSGVSRVLRSRGKASRLRLVNTSRGLPTLDSYTWESDLITKTRHLFNLTNDGGVFSTILAPERWRGCQLAALFSVRDGRELVRFFRNLYSPISADIHGYLLDRAKCLMPCYIQGDFFEGETSGLMRKSCAKFLLCKPRKI